MHACNKCTCTHNARSLKRACLDVCREFKSKDAAGQLNRSPHEFSGISGLSPLVWVSKGYAVLSGPSMPIIAEGEEEPNDTFVEQLVGTRVADATLLCLHSNS